MDYDVIVIGEGVAGLTAAGEIAGRGHRVATMEAQLFGGLIININDLEPAAIGGTASGAEYASSLVEAASNAGVESINEPVTGLDVSAGGIKVLTDGGSRSAKQVVVASGARIKRLGIPGEMEFEGKGVSQCADCDGPMYQNEVAVVVGGGDSALQEALVLAQYCKSVRLVQHSGAFTGSAHLQAAVKGNDKIETTFNAEVTAVGGGQMVEKVTIKHKDGRSEDIASAGLFAYIGLTPNSEFLPAAVARDAQGYVVANDKLETAASGVWAAGAVRSGCGGLLDDAVADGKKVAAGVCAKLGR